MANKVDIEQPFETLENLFNFIELGWIDQKAETKVKVIKRKSEFPKWEDCKKDHFYFGIIRRKRGDRVVIIKHRTSLELDCRIPAEQLTPKDLLLSAWPERKDMHCSECGEYATRIDAPGVCVDCSTKNKVH